VSLLRRAAALAWLACAAGFAGSAAAQVEPAAQVGWEHAEIQVPGGTVTVHYPARNLARLSFVPKDGKPGAATSVIDPAATIAPPDHRLSPDASALPRQWLLRDGALVAMRDGRELLRVDAEALARGEVLALHGASDPLYGIHGYGAFERADGGLQRAGAQVAKAGEQGYAGAPFVWSTAGYGVLADAEGADFALKDGRIAIRGRRGQPIHDVYVFIGDPKTLFGALAQVSGRSPLFPKWAMGFTNSQWGIDQKELLRLVDTYRAKHIPIDNFTIDFDWKAWGEDGYGEFRWNAAKFPDGPDGKLKALLDGKGMHLTGIMKPRLHVDTVEGRYATEHGLWSTASKPAPDYFSHKTVRDVDFDKPATRAWFFNDALKHSFDTGIAGWWNDEADTLDSDTQFLNMQRALYDGQRAYSDKRVWSINRNFYLGSQRYAYGLWSGDIDTGFASMKAQRQRMLSAINVGAMQWGMDGGGFKKSGPKADPATGGTTPENYARWIQFGAFTPIFRVHGELGIKRQPWVYGPVAEKAATAAIRLRYALMPYIYSYEYQRRATGVGLVRPLLFDWPEDPNVREDVDAWMFGEHLLVSPVVEQGQSAKNIYLPAGHWFDYASGRAYEGGRTIHYALDAKTWSDIPLFVREGAIVPMQTPVDYVGQRPLREVEVEVFPAERRTSFPYYDDDGETYAYEQGGYFLQTLAAQRAGQGATVELAAPEGGYRPALAWYLLKVHGMAAGAVDAAGQALPESASLDALRTRDGEGWARGSDRFGPVTWVRVAAGRARHISLTPGPSSSKAKSFSLRRPKEVPVGEKVPVPRGLALRRSG
jgi:alpha-glucosidase (family GH31 glycosyl hydrolase)